MKPQAGFAFALSRLVARLGGRNVCRAQWSAPEAYGVCLLVFLISWVGTGRLLPLLVRAGILRLVLFAAVPLVLWLVFLLLYYLISLVIRIFRRFGFFLAASNAFLQHLFFASLTTLLSFFLLRSGSGLLQVLGSLWLGLVALNLVSILIEQLLDRP